MKFNGIPPRFSHCDWSDLLYSGRQYTVHFLFVRCFRTVHNDECVLILNTVQKHLYIEWISVSCLLDVNPVTTNLTCTLIIFRYVGMPRTHLLGHIQPLSTSFNIDSLHIVSPNNLVRNYVISHQNWHKVDCSFDKFIKFWTKTTGHGKMN